MARSIKLSDHVIRHLVIKHPQKLFDAMVTALDGGEPVVAAPEAPAKAEPSKEEPSKEESSEGGDAE